MHGAYFHSLRQVSVERILHVTADNASPTSLKSPAIYCQPLKSRTLLYARSYRLLPAGVVVRELLHLKYNVFSYTVAKYLDIDVSEYGFRVEFKRFPVSLTNSMI